MATKKPMASKATQKQYDKKLASRGKMTDAANKARYEKLIKPSAIKDVAKKAKPTAKMATKALSTAGRAAALVRGAGALGMAGTAGYAIGKGLNKKYGISDKIVSGAEKIRDAVKKRRSMSERAKAMRKGK